MSKFQARVAGIETMVCLYKKIKDSYRVVSQGITVAEFKRQISSKEDVSKFTVFFNQPDGQMERLEDDDVLDDRLQNCALHLISTEDCATLEMDHSTSSRPSSEEKPYSWFYQLPEKVRGQRISEKHAVLFGYVIEDCWPCVLLLLGFTSGELEIIVHDKRDLHLPHSTGGLIQWIKRLASKATLQALFDRLVVLEEVKSGQIKWQKIKYIMEQLSSDNT